MDRRSDREGSSASRVVRPAALPVQLTSFVGREREIDALRALLEETRLLTITGAGGSGKTRLALELAARSAPVHADGVLWIELAALIDPQHLAAHVATVLGIREDAAPSPEEAIIGSLRDERRLLALDNCEHVVDATARLVALLLRSCPHLRVLATSREALGIGGERSWLVPTLSLPSVDDARSATLAGASEAVRLFVERARDASATFAMTDANAGAVVRICERVDGLPLAIELAAARVRALTPEQIASRLDESFRLLSTSGRGSLPRHRTLQAAIEWSYALLAERERDLLERLSVFAGSFSLEAAEYVCAEDAIGAEAAIGTEDVLDLVAELVGKSLVAMQETEGVARYRLLESVRQYAKERLHGASDGRERRVRARHGEFFRDLAVAAEAHAIVGDPAWLRRLDTDTDNLRAALAWSHEEHRDSEVGLPLASSLVWYWYHRNLWLEGSRALEQVLDGSADATPIARARALHGTGIFANYVGDLAFADRRLHEAESIWRTHGETRHARWLAFALIGRCTVALATDRPNDAKRLAEESVEVAACTGDSWDVAIASGYALMAVKVARREWKDADALLVDAERVFRARAYAYGLAFVLDARAYVALQLGNVHRSAALALDVLSLLSERVDHWLASRSIRILATVAARTARPERAATLWGVADGMLASIGARALATERDGMQDAETAVRHALSRADYERARDGGAKMSYREAIAYALRDAATLESPDDSSSVVVQGEQRGDADDPAVEPQAPLLEVRTLGRLEFRLRGRVLAPDAWRYAKPRELVLFLLAHPAGRTRDQVGLVFWPDASAAQVKNNFHVALHQLRRALGAAELIVFDGDRYAINWSLGVEHDAHRFEEEVRSAMRGGDDALPVLEGALARYGGDFLEDARVGDWHLEHRERLQRLFVQGQLALGEFLASAGRADHEAEAYRRILSRDPLHEEAHRRLLASLGRAGRRSEALRHYDHLVALLRNELGAAPDSATVALVERLRDGGAP